MCVLVSMRSIASHTQELATSWVLSGLTIPSDMGKEVAGPA